MCCLPPMAAPLNREGCSCAASRPWLRQEGSNNETGMEETGGQSSVAPPGTGSRSHSPVHMLCCLRLDQRFRASFPAQRTA